MNGENLPKWRSGVELDSASLNELARGLELANTWKVAPGTGLVLRETGHGVRLHREAVKPIWGKLSGSTSPYTYVEQLDDGTGTWANGTRSGTAYEVNSTASLGGKVVRLHPDRVGAWRFQWHKSTTSDITVCSLCTLPTVLHATGSYQQDPGGSFSPCSNSGGTSYTTVPVAFDLTYTPGSLPNPEYLSSLITVTMERFLIFNAPACSSTVQYKLVFTPASISGGNCAKVVLYESLDGGAFKQPTAGTLPVYTSCSPLNLSFAGGGGVGVGGVYQPITMTITI